jgi:alpha/beta superfamily hydrolase
MNGFTVLRFNFRGIGKSEGVFDNGEGELNDAAAALDWLQAENPHARKYWVAGFSFGAWVTMQLLMRRPELDGFVAVSPPANIYDFNFLAPCPVSGLMVQGDKDEVVSYDAVKTLSEKLSNQKGIDVQLERVPEGDHFFTNKLSCITQTISQYLQENKAAPIIGQ